MLLFLNIINNISCKHIWGYNFERYQNLNTELRKGGRNMSFCKQKWQSSLEYLKTVKKRKNFFFSKDGSKVLNLRSIIEILLHHMAENFSHEVPHAYTVERISAVKFLPTNTMDGGSEGSVYVPWICLKRGKMEKVNQMDLNMCCWM